jgi:HAD superfamily hydrolase (TIGR01484 family)
LILQRHDGECTVANEGVGSKRRELLPPGQAPYDAPQIARLSNRFALEMTSPIKLISTDFDGTIFAEFENPPIPMQLQELITSLQQRGTRWVINTGRDMSSLMEALARARVTVQPDFLVVVEREIYRHDGVRYVGVEPWNAECTRSHEEIFEQVRPDLPRLVDWVNARFEATIYEDPYSPFCLIAGNNAEAEMIHHYLDDYCRTVPHLTVMRNDVYARLSHDRFDKGTALAEICRSLGISATEVFAAGDHLNDLPMLSRSYAHWLAAPQNAIDPVKAAVRSQNGYISELSHGGGTAEALMFHLKNANR